MSKLFFVFATQRSGTTALRSCINSTRDYYEYGEVFFPTMFERGFYSGYAAAIAADPGLVLPARRGEYFDRYVRSAAKTRKETVVGFDIKYTHLCENPGILRSAGATGGTAIHLVRQNLLESYVSSQVMEKRMELGIVSRGTVHGETVPPPVQLEIDTKKIVGHLETRRQKIRTFQADIEKHFSSWIILTYEGLFEADGDASYLSKDSQKKIQDEIGVKMRPRPTTKLAKQTPFGTHNIVLNYSELSEVLRDTEFAYMAR